LTSKKERLDECWEKQEFPHEMLPDLAAMGLGGISTSKEYGGLGLSFMDFQGIMFEIGQHD
jgi:alkylation response protein AidB-like acyl-CoA dehydrogenase